MNYEKYFKEAEEIIAHHKAGDSTAEWADKYTKMHLISTTLSKEEREKLVASLRGRDVESLSCAEKCLFLALYCGLKYEESVNLRHSDFIVNRDGDDVSTCICIKRDESSEQNYMRMVPLSLMLHVMVTGLPGRNGKEENVHVVGMSETEADVQRISDGVYELLKEKGLISEDRMTALAVFLVEEKEEFDLPEVTESELVEYMLRRSFATDKIAHGYTEEQVSYFMGLPVEGE